MSDGRGEESRIVAHHGVSMPARSSMAHGVMEDAFVMHGYDRAATDAEFVGHESTGVY